MKEIPSIDRHQIKMQSLDRMVDQDSVVRLLDVFLEWSLSQDLGFVGST